jgi:hypothetical protein
VLGPVGCSLLNHLVVSSAVTVLQIVEKIMILKATGRSKQA